MSARVGVQAFQEDAWPGSDFQPFLDGTVPGEHPNGNLALDAQAALVEDAWQAAAEQRLGYATGTPSPTTNTAAEPPKPGSSVICR